MRNISRKGHGQRLVLGFIGLGLLLVMALGGSTLAFGAAEQGPAPVVRSYYDKVVNVLSNEDLDKEKLRQELKDMAREVFTFQVMAQMSMARNWRDLDSEQQKEFVSLFTRLLENTYFQKIEKHLDEITEYAKDDLQVTDEIIFSSRKAEVQSKIAYEDKQVPVNYRFVKMDGKWKIYDVLVEEVSLVQNYRSQFSDRLQKVSVGQFMQDLRDKVQALEAGEEEADLDDAI